jgi:hypothetical protein
MRLVLKPGGHIDLLAAAAHPEFRLGLLPDIQQRVKEVQRTLSGTYRPGFGGLENVSHCGIQVKT